VAAGAVAVLVVCGSVVGAVFFAVWVLLRGDAFRFFLVVGLSDFCAVSDFGSLVTVVTAVCGSAAVLLAVSGAPAVPAVPVPAVSADELSGSAQATAGMEVRPAPIPRATASAPTRPTYRAWAQIGASFMG
jgi:hypothetical protein